MPTKGTLPTSKELQGQVLAALRELDGEAHFNEIDRQVKRNLEPWVHIREFKKETLDFYETSFSSKCARARRSLKADGLLMRGEKRGHWQLSRPTKADRLRVRRRSSNNVSKFAGEAIEKLEKRGVTTDVINSIRELWQEFLLETPEVHPDNEVNLEVEKKAIAFILKREPEKNWRQTDNHANPGFDLYRADENGKVISWCEVKSLSRGFGNISLSKTQFGFARRKGKKYWLYIVANVQTGSPSLIRISDPARKAETFTFGTPWRNVAAD